MGAAVKQLLSSVAHLSAWLTFRETMMIPKLRKRRQLNEFSSFIPSMVLKCSSRTESSSTFVFELIVLDFLVIGLDTVSQS